MGFPIPQGLIEKVLHDVIGQMKAQDIVGVLIAGLKAEIEKLKGDADHDGTPDYIEIEQQLVIIEKAVKVIMQHLEAQPK